MKRTLSLLLAVLLPVCLFSGRAGTRFAFAEEAAPSSAETCFSDSIEAQAFALAMAFYTGGFAPDTSTADPAFLLEASGWYAAWLYRTQEIELLDEGLVRDFQRSLGARELSPVSGADSTRVRILRGPEGKLFYEFPFHRAQMDALLGQTLAFFLDAPAEPEACVVLQEHYSLHALREYRCTFRFVPGGDPDSAFAYTLCGADVPPPGPEMDPALDFDWAGLLAANSLTNLLSLYPSVEVTGSPFSPDPVRFFLRDGDLCVLNCGETGIAGEYRGMRFEAAPAKDGKMHACIYAFEDSAGALSLWDGYVADHIRDAAAVTLERTEDELFHIRLGFPGDRQMEAAVKRGVLSLQELVLDGGGEEAPAVTGFFYDEAPPAAFLDSWDGPLRRVTLEWESWENGARKTRTETVRIPADWEYLPWEGIRGDYTVYLDEGYTKPYAYPGDGGDYTLWLTTAKG